MGSKEFIEKCKEIVKQYALEHLDKSDNIPEFGVFDVWYCKTLQNHKALAFGRFRRSRRSSSVIIWDFTSG